MTVEHIQLVLEHGSEPVVLPGSTLLVGLDETGHEAFADPEYPIFGLGGCAVMVRDYPRLINDPWRYMKKRFFGIEDEPLHAAALREPSPEQVDALGQFFRNFQFSRLATLATDRTLFGKGLACLPVVGASLVKRLSHIIAAYPDATSVVLVFEESQRASAAMVQSVSGYELKRSRPDGSTTPIPIDKFVMPESCAEPFLEVADFVMHAAGSHTRARLRGAEKPNRKDFRVVFRDVDKRLVSYIEISGAQSSVSEPIGFDGHADVSDRTKEGLASSGKEDP